MIRRMNRHAFDLNLLRVFHAVFTVRDVRRSAELLGHFGEPRQSWTRLTSMRLRHRFRFPFGA